MGEVGHVVFQTVRMTYVSVVCALLLHWCMQCLPTDHHNAQLLVLCYLVYRHNNQLFKDVGLAMGYAGKGQEFVQLLKHVWSAVSGILFLKLFLVAYLGWELDLRRRGVLSRHGITVWWSC